MPITRRRKIIRKRKPRAAKKDALRIPRIAMLHKEVVPAKFFTRLQYNYHGVEAVAAGNNLDYALWANNPQGPGNVTGFVIGSTALLAPPGLPIDMGGILTSTGHALGLTKFMSQTAGSQLYTSCHVLKSHIKIQYIPNALTDSLYVSILPQKDSDSTPLDSQLRGMSAPYAKSKVITTSTPQKDQTIKHSIDLAKFLGVTPSTYLSNPAYAYNSSHGNVFVPARVENEGAQVFWVVRRTLCNGSAVSFPLAYTVEVIYDVVFQGQLGEDISV